VRVPYRSDGSVTPIPRRVYNAGELVTRTSAAEHSDVLSSAIMDPRRHASSAAATPPRTRDYSDCHPGRGMPQPRMRMCISVLLGEAHWRRRAWLSLRSFYDSGVRHYYF